MSICCTSHQPDIFRDRAREALGYERLPAEGEIAALSCPEARYARSILAGAVLSAPQPFREHKRRCTGRQLLELLHYYSRQQEPHYYHATGSLLYHGTPTSLQELGDVLLPQQPSRQDVKGRLFVHGKPSICTSDHYEFPIVRALLKESAPAFQGLQIYNTLILARASDSQNKLILITSAEAMEALQKHDATGNVCVVKRPTNIQPWSPEYPEEYRFYEPVPLFGSVAVETSDLPRNLIVAEGKRSEIQPALDLIRRIGVVAAFDAVGVKAHILGGIWPEDEWPH